MPSLGSAIKELQDRDEGAHEEALSRLATLVTRRTAWPFPGAWSPGEEREVASLLCDLLHGYQWRDSPPASSLFLVSELMFIEPWGRKRSLEVWRTRSLRFTGRSVPPVLFALRADAVAESHDRGEAGWHIHPLDRKGRRMAYRCLFDSLHDQNDLGWENHGRGPTPLGDPSETLLPTKTARSLYAACLAAVAHQATFRGQKFGAWADRFVRPSAKTYVAHCDAAPLRAVDKMSDHSHP